MIRLLARPAVLVATAALALASQIAILRILEGLGDPRELLELQTTLSQTHFLEIMERWGDAGKAVFYDHFRFDFVHPILYGLFFASAIATLSVRRGRGEGLVAIPLVAGLCDEIENVAQLTLVRGLPDFPSALFYAGALASLAKWVLVAVSIAAIAWLALRPRAAGA